MLIRVLARSVPPLSVTWVFDGGFKTVETRKTFGAAALTFGLDNTVGAPPGDHRGLPALLGSGHESDRSRSGSREETPQGRRLPGDRLTPEPSSGRDEDTVGQLGREFVVALRWPLKSGARSTIPGGPVTRVARVTAAGWLSSVVAPEGHRIRRA